MTKPIVIESTEGGEGVLETDTDAWKRGPVAKDEPFKRDSDRAAPKPEVDKLEINERLRP